MSTLTPCIRGARYERPSRRRLYAIVRAGTEMKRHNLKILPNYYEAQVAGIKTFELRRLDRDFKVGDEIKLNEIDRAENSVEYKPTGRSCLVRINYICAGFEGLEDGYGVLGTELIYSP